MSEEIKDKKEINEIKNTNEIKETKEIRSRNPRSMIKEDKFDLKGKRIVVPDTSVIIDGRLSEILKEKNIYQIRVVIHKASVGELEHQANSGKEIGFSGLAEIKLLREFSQAGQIELEFGGERSTELMVRAAKLGEVDAAIRELAKQLNAMLITSDKVQSEVARAEGIDVIYLEPRRYLRELSFKQYLTPDTVSLHFKEDTVPLAKRGKPGNIQLVKVRQEPTTKDELELMIKEIIDTARADSKSYFELDAKGATVIQLREFRIAIARQPFSDGIEITIVRPIMKASLDDYTLSDKLRQRLLDRAEGIIICGSPGSGKSTFAAALAEMYMKNKKIVKTLESPRDLQVPEEITQYAPLDGSFEKTGDILLLVRPDYSIYDEMRKTNDFKVFSDLRLSGIGMVGIVHATRPIESIQRFIGRVDLGMIPQIVDTVIFIKEGKIKKVLELKMKVKIPYGMRDRDLARPVVQVSDFETGKVEWEIYKFGDETVSIQIESEDKNKWDKRNRRR